MSKKSTREELDIFDWVPEFEDLNLGVNATNVSVTTSKFDYITSIIVTLQLTDAATEFSEFLPGAALTNGLFITVDGNPITPVIKTKAELLEIGISYVSPPDNDNMRVYHIQLDFVKWCGNLGMQIQKVDGDREVVFDINDDLSSITGLFSANVHGWKAI